MTGYHHLLCFKCRTSILVCCYPNQRCVSWTTQLVPSLP